jgi:hypothetical protein
MLQLVVLGFQLLQPLRFAHLQSAVPRLPTVKSLLAGGVLPAQLRRAQAGLGLLQNSYDLFCGESALLQG